MHETTFDSEPILLPFRPRATRPLHLGHRPGAQRGGLHRRHAGPAARARTTTRTASRSSSPTAARPTRTRDHRRRRWPAAPQRPPARQPAAAGRAPAATSPSAPARGDLVVLVDGHCELDNPHYLADLADAFARSGADCVGRPQPLDVTRGDAAAAGHRRGPGVAAGPPPRLVHLLRPPRASCRRRASPSPTAARCSRRSACSTRRSTPARTWSSTTASTGPGCAASSRRGCASATTRAARLAGLFRQMVRYGRGRVRLLRKHPETFSAGRLRAGGLPRRRRSPGRSWPGWRRGWRGLYAGAWGCTPLVVLP